VEKILVLLHDIDIKKRKVNSDGKRAKFEYLSSLFYGLLEIIAIENTIESNHAKRIMLESFCFNAKRILDLYKVEFKDSIYFYELKKVRNILAHDVITYQVNDNGITFNNYEKGMEIRYSKYYSTGEGTFNISRFMSYYTKLLVRSLSEILSSEIYTGLHVADKYLNSGVDILSKYEMKLDSLHDQYVKIIVPVNEQPNDALNGAHYNEDYEDKCKQALEWIKGKESIFPVEYLHINISLSVQAKEIEESINYANRSDKIIEDIKDEHPFVSMYLTHIYASLHRNYYRSGDKRRCLEYALKSIDSVRKIHVNLLEKIIFYVNLANAYSLYKSRRECKVLLDCFNMVCEAKDGSYKNISNHQFMVFGNLLECFTSHKKNIPVKCISLFSSLVDSELPKELKKEFKIKMARYYLSVKMLPESSNLINEMITKKVVKGNEKLTWQLELLYAEHLDGKCISSEFISVGKKVEKLKMKCDEEKYIYKQYEQLKKVI